MVVDFRAIDFGEQPVLVLCNTDSKAIQTLGYAFNLKANLCYNETSMITFDYPAYVDGVKTPHYDDIVGMRIVEMAGWGRFTLVNPSVQKTGVKEIKSCKAYSLEYELTYKNIYLEEDTYNFWNPVAPDETVLGIILSYIPSWSVGTVDSELIGKYRTFSESGTKLYDFIKSTAQQSYNCIFDFDTYNRKINVMSVSSRVSVAPVYISLENLAKEINVEEDTENIITALDVNGAEGVDIRSVNPMGTNKLYNLDYFMNDSHVSQEMMDKWAAWKQSFESNQLEYYNASIERVLKTSAILTEQAVLTMLRGRELAELENLQSVYIEYLASIIDRTSPEYIEYQNKLSQTTGDIAAKHAEIEDQESIISVLESEKDALTQKLIDIHNNVSFSSFFNEDEILTLNLLFKEDSINESSFMVPAVESYSDAGESGSVSNTILVFSGGEVTKIEGVPDKELFAVSGGELSFGDGESPFFANVVRASFEQNVIENKFVLSVYLGHGVMGDTSFPGGCVSFTGTCTDVTSNVVPDPDIPDAYATGSLLMIDVDTSNMYFTRNTTEYERYAVEWDLYEYGRECLEKLAYPSYTFNVSVANFFMLDEFVLFANKLSLGQKIYLDIGDEGVLQPILIGAEIDFENPSSMNLAFGDRYNLSDSVFKLVDLLEQSISMGKTIDTSKFNYNSFIDSGASTGVKQFMESALDASKNAILSGGNMEITWNGSGIRGRKRLESGGFSDEQIAIINNSICFTDDGWQTAKMAIGKFTDSNTGDSWGIVAPSLTGTLLAGRHLIIESEKKDGEISVFKVDGDGAVLHNARFDIENGVSHVVLDPQLGFGIGDYPVISYDDEGLDSWDDDNAKFWVDIEGNIHFKGTLEGCTGLFTGSLKVGGDTGLRVDDMGNLKIGGTDIDPNFYVSAAGVLNAKSGDFSGAVDAYALKINGVNILTNTGAGGVATDDSQISSEYLDLGNIQLDGVTGDITMMGNLNLSGLSSITWGGAFPVKSQFSTSLSGPWSDTMLSTHKYRRDSNDGGITWGGAYQFRGTDGSDASVPGYIHSNYIGSTIIKSPTIETNILNVITPSGFTEAGYRLVDAAGEQIMKIFYQNINGPTVVFQAGIESGVGSGYDASAIWDFRHTDFYGMLDFSSAQSVHFGKNAPEARFG